MEFEKMLFPSRTRMILPTVSPLARVSLAVLLKLRRLQCLPQLCPFWPVCKALSYQLVSRSVQLLDARCCWFCRRHVSL